MTDAINTGMYATGAPPNALQTLGQMQGIAAQNQQMQLHALQIQQAQQQMAAKQAMGPILQAAVDPSTGELNYNKAFLGLAGNPATAFLAGDFLSQGIQRKQTQAETALKELDLKTKQQGQIYDALKGLAAKGNMVTQEDAIAAITDRFNAGTLDRTQYQNALDMVKRYPSGASLQGFVKQTMLGSMAAKDALEQVNGTLHWQDVGGEMRLIQQNPMNGTARVLMRQSKTLTPEQMVQQTPGAPDAQGNPTAVSMAQRAQDQGLGGLVSNPIPQSFGGGVPEGTPMAGAGGGLQTPSIAAPGQGDGAGAMSQGGVTPPGSAAPPPASVKPTVVGAGEMSKHIQQDNAKYVNETANSVAKIGDAVSTLEHMEGLLNSFKAGPGADYRQQMASFLQSIGASEKDTAKITGGPQGLAAMQTFQNLALKYATQQLKQAIEGSRITNMEFKAVVDTKPNVSMRPEAIKAVISQARMAYALAQKQAGYMNQWLDEGKNLTTFRNVEMPKFMAAANKQLRAYYAQPGQL